MSDESLSPQDLRALIASASELATVVRQDELLQRILDRAGRLPDAPDSSVILYNDRRRSLYIAAATGANADWVLATYGRHSTKQIPVDDSKAGTVFASGESLLENAVCGHFAGVDEETRQPTRTMSVYHSTSATSGSASCSCSTSAAGISPYVT